MNPRDLNPPDRPDVTDEEMENARMDLAELIVAGQKAGGMTILDCLDCECDDDNIAFLADLAKLFEYLHKETPSEFWCRAENYLMRIAMRHVPESAVFERASERDAEEELASQNQPEEG